MDKSLLVNFGKRLKALREAKGLKQREMADIMGLKLRQYQRYEYGEIGVPLEVLNFFADYFGVTADYLLGRGEAMSHKSIAIDGPAGAGKSTLARQLAGKLGFLYVDTGAIYRTVALKVLREKADPADPGQVVPLLDGLDIRMDYGRDGVQRMYLEGEDVSDAIRRHEVSGAASRVSAIGEVRAFLLDLQRKLARERDVVMDGRDIGTVVLPRADVKIFLTAAPEARARRRLLELEQRGEPADFDALLRDIRQRDYQDEHRAIAPLKRAADAAVLDTTQLNLEQSLERLLLLVKEKVGR